MGFDCEVEVNCVGEVGEIGEEVGVEWFAEIIINWRSFFIG
jgi:hypothetical protein